MTVHLLLQSPLGRAILSRRSVQSTPQSYSLDELSGLARVAHVDPYHELAGVRRLSRRRGGDVSSSDSWQLNFKYLKKWKSTTEVNFGRLGLSGGVLFFQEREMLCNISSGVAFWNQSGRDRGHKTVFAANFRWSGSRLIIVHRLYLEKEIPPILQDVTGSGTIWSYSCDLASLSSFTI